MTIYHILESKLGLNICHSIPHSLFIALVHVVYSGLVAHYSFECIVQPNIQPIDGFSNSIQLVGVLLFLRLGFLGRICWAEKSFLLVLDRSEFVLDIIDKAFEVFLLL